MANVFADTLLKQYPERADALCAVIAEAEREGESIVSAVERTGLVDPALLLGLVAKYHQIDCVVADDYPLDAVLIDGLSLAFLRMHSILPLKIMPDGKLLLAVADPWQTLAIEAVGIATKRKVLIKAASARNILDHIDRLAPEVVSGEEPEFEREVFGQDPPVVELLNRIFSDAANARATDIHLEAERRVFAIRIRVDGMLRLLLQVPHAMGRGLLARIKILSGLNVAERRLSQDGNMRTRIHASDYDVRITTFSVTHGEAAVLRLLPGSRNLMRLSSIGFSEGDLFRIQSSLSLSSGLIIATGPTGSGKTTSLASLVSELNTPERKIVSIEDPVEYQIPGVSQTQIRPDIGITFASALRSFMRADPDVIMIGEMRDKETVQIGVQASLTGHLVLTTLHTTSASGAITRLVDMGVEPFLLASSLSLVIGQRLVRVLCPHCRDSVEMSPPFSEMVLRQVGGKSGRAVRLFRPKGCPHCSQTGYRGRVAIFEVMTIDAKLQELIRLNASSQELEAMAVSSGMKTLIADGYAKCLAGLTSPEEVIRVANG
jgi:general secretion pathway protein E